MDVVALDPKEIVIDRETRQRQRNINDIADLKASISQVGILNPIIVRRLPDGKYSLVAGERRLKSALELDLPTVPVRDFGTLARAEAEVIELEENVKRAELHWRDHVRSVGRLHKIYRERHSGRWTLQQTADELSIHQTYLSKLLKVHEQLDSPRLAQASSMDQAYNTLQQFSERKAESIVNDIIANAGALFADAPPPSSPPTGPQLPVLDMSSNVLATVTIPQAPPTSFSSYAPEPSTPAEPPKTYTQDLPIPSPPKLEPPPPVICASFLEWAPTYAGPKFSLIHCDFPYGNYKGDDSAQAMQSSDTIEFYDNHEEIYWTLLDCLVTNLDRLMSYSAHMIFWFNMNFYSQTVEKFRAAGLSVHDHPLIWHKTTGGGGLGVQPGTAATHPRRTYDTALLAGRGKRPLAKPICNSYSCPTAGNKIHPSQKPEPMLRYFLQGVVDETTSVLDPTCGSAAALRAAEDLGARSILGIEMDRNYAELANNATLRARILRNHGG